MKNEYLTKETVLGDLCFQEYFLWICKQRNKEYKKITGFKKNNINIYYFLELKELNFIRIESIRNKRFVVITAIGISYYNKIRGDIFLHNINHQYNYFVKRERSLNRNKLKKFLTSKGYSFNDNNKEELTITKNFSKYHIYFQNYFNKLNNDIESIYKKTHTLIIVVESLEEKIKFIYLINKFLLNKYADLNIFISEGYSYSVVTINDILSNVNFPSKLPTNSNFLNTNYIKEDSNNN